MCYIGHYTDVVRKPGYGSRIGDMVSGRDILVVMTDLAQCGIETRATLAFWDVHPWLPVLPVKRVPLILLNAPDLKAPHKYLLRITNLLSMWTQEILLT